MASIVLCGNLNLPALSCCTRSNNDEDDDLSTGTPSRVPTSRQLKTKNAKKGKKVKKSKDKIEREKTTTHHFKHKHTKTNTPHRRSPRHHPPSLNSPNASNSSNSTPTSFYSTNETPTSPKAHRKSKISATSISPKISHTHHQLDERQNVRMFRIDSLSNVHWDVESKPKKHGLLRRILGPKGDEKRKRHKRETKSTKTKTEKPEPQVNTLPKMTTGDSYVVVDESASIVSIYGYNLEKLIGCSPESMCGTHLFGESPKSIDSDSALVFLDILRGLWNECKSYNQPVGVTCQIQSVRRCVFTCTPIVYSGMFVHISLEV